MEMKDLTLIRLLVLLLLPVFTLAAERTQYFVNDAAGSPVAAMDEQGAVVWREGYAPYGERVVRATENPGRPAYTGKPEDAETGLVYMGARWYDPEAARFTGIDPQGFADGNPQSFGRYTYANNNPYRYTDPNGESPVDVVFLAYDAVTFASAVYAGDRAAIWESGVDLAASALGVVSPVPGTGELIKVARATDKLADAGRAAGVAKGVTRSLDDLSSLRGARLSDVEKMADAKYLQQGWTKSPLKDGNGIRYFDGKGNSFQLNKGYPGGKEMHGGPYIKTTQGNQSVRIPLEGNPDL